MVLLASTRGVILNYLGMTAQLVLLAEFGQTKLETTCQYANKQRGIGTNMYIRQLRKFIFN